MKKKRPITTQERFTCPFCGQRITIRMFMLSGDRAEAEIVNACQHFSCDGSVCFTSRDITARFFREACYD